MMLRSWLKKIGIVLIELALIAGALVFIAQKKGIQNVAQIAPALKQQMAEQQIKKVLFPALERPIVKDFSWTYKGVSYVLPVTLDESAYEFYKIQPRVYSYEAELPANWEEDYYGMFLKMDSSDQAIARLASDLEVLGKKQKLNNDQIVELVLAFVQSIEYDDAKAASILDQTGKESMLRPYELLFEQKGVCSDKSLLAIAILRQMGYGAAAFIYPEENHMAIGIQCPKEYSTYGSGYCYAETTAVGNKIGIIPSIDLASNKTVLAGELPELDSGILQQLNLQQLGQVDIFQKTSGKEYLGIIQTQKNIAEIDALKKTIEMRLSQLQAQQKKIKKQEKQLQELKNELEKNQNAQNVEKYNSLVVEYNDLLEIYKKDAKKYNNDSALYNKSIARYNLLIKGLLPIPLKNIIPKSL